MRHGVLATAALAAALLAAAGNAFGFSGEDLKNGSPWHHEDITRRALAGDEPRYDGAGFTNQAAASIAWHADYVDSYAYNPLWWLAGDSGRLDAVLVGRPELAKLHFDDVFSTGGVLGTWQRYAAGTLIGLYWASLRDGSGDLTAGQNVLGASLHAVQDFYSHSNWIDDVDRRCQTFLQVEPETRAGLSLHTGAYELAASGAPHHHGAFSLSCSLMRGRAFDTGLGPLCSGLSPLQNLPMCETFRACSSATGITFSVDERQDGTLLYLDPPGIAMDSIWMSRVQARNRGLLDAEGNFLPGLDGHHFRQSQCQIIVHAKRGAVCSPNADMLFAGSKDLAIRASTEWVQYLEAAMTAMGPRQAAFWSRVKSEGEGEVGRIDGFEDLSLLPYLFLSAGPYPEGNAFVPGRDDVETSAGWFLRLDIETDDSIGSGTDADIYAEVAFAEGASIRQLIDRRADNGPITGYDDFEEGDHDAYMIGPFAAQPTGLTLVNDAGGAGAITSGAWAEFTQSMESVLTSGRQSLIALIAGNADYVGTATAHLDHPTVKRLLAGAGFSDGSLNVDGGDQGKFRFDYRLRPMAHLLTEDEATEGWLAFEVQVRRMESLVESTVDRFSSADEPFVLFLASPLNGKADPVSAYLSDPIADFDAGETHTFARRTGSASIIKIPPEGGVVLSVRVFESDSETQGDRETLRRMFETGLKESELEADARFIGEIGRVIAPDWTIAGLEVFAFQRSASPMAGPVLARRGLPTIEGNASSPLIPLDWSQVRSLGTADGSIGAFQAEPVTADVLDGPWHAMGYGCSTAVERQRIDIKVEGDALTATKTLGDPCQPDGAVTWAGTFADGLVTATLLPGVEPDPALNFPPEPRPNPRDPAVDPNLPLEGNWMIRWEGDSGETPGYAVLSKGGSWTCVDNPDVGCWYRFFREADAEWRLGFWADDGGNSASVEMTGPGQFTALYGYGHLGYSGGASMVSGGLDALSGMWKQGDRSGTEVWERVVSRVDRVAWPDGPGQEADVGGPPVTVRSVYSDAGNAMRGNRPSFVLNLLGENLWGRHDYWMPRAEGLEIKGLSYLCKPAEDGYVVHGDFWVCLRQGGVIGVQLSFNVWSEARPGPQVLYFDDAEIVFNLELEGYPQPAEARETQFALQSCNVLAEVDPPQGQGLIFTRSAPFP
jgi:hypothetical protein